MPAKNKAFVVYPDDTTAVQIEELRQYFSDRQGGIKISDGKLGRDLINEKHTEILNKQNNSARITTLVEKEEVTQETLSTLADKEEVTQEVLTTLAQEVRRLVKSIDRLREEMKDVRPSDN
jgi:uncharacterized protein YnzC (UPF0291/DUF896 family)